MTSNLDDQIPSNDEKLNFSKDILDKDTMSKVELPDPPKKESKEEDILKDMDKSFYTKSMDLSDKDFNFSDREDAPSKIMTALKIILLLALVAGIITAIYFLIKTF